MERAIDKPKRYLSEAEYKRKYNISTPTLKKALESGAIKGVRTECGHWRIDTQADNPEYSAIIERLDRQEQLIKALSRHFGVKV